MLITAETGSLAKPLFILAALAIAYVVYMFRTEWRRSRFELFASEYNLHFERFEAGYKEMAVIPGVDAFFSNAKTRNGCYFLVSGGYLGLYVYVTDVETAEDGFAEHKYTAVLVRSPSLNLPEFHMSPRGAVKASFRGTEGLRISNDEAFTRATHLVAADEESLLPYLSEEFRARFQKDHKMTIEGQGNTLCISKYPRKLSVAEVGAILRSAPDMVKELSKRPV